MKVVSLLLALWMQVPATVNAPDHRRRRGSGQQKDPVDYDQVLHPEPEG